MKKTGSFCKIVFLSLFIPFCALGQGQLTGAYPIHKENGVWQDSHRTQIYAAGAPLPVKLTDIRWTYVPSPGDAGWHSRKEVGIPLDLGKTARIDLDKVSPKNARPDDFTRVYGEFVSDRDGILRMGVSTDWWWDVYANGIHVYDALSQGSRNSKFLPEERPFYLPVKKGSNLIAIRLCRGSASRMFAVQVLQPEKLTPPPTEEKTADLHVSLTGKNENSGESPDRALPGIQMAYDRIVKLHRAKKNSRKYRILVHGGRYELKKPLHFYAQVPVEIRPYNDEKVEISGGRILKDWERTTVNGKVCFRTILPAGVDEIPFLFVNGKYAEPARWPKTGFLIPENFPAGEKQYDSFCIKKGDFRKDWYDPENIWVRMTHLWMDENLRLESCSEQGDRIRTACEIQFKVSKKSRYFFFNVREALTEKNEFYYDRKRREILYIPERTDKPFTAVIPGLGVLVQADSGVRNLTLHRLVFCHGGKYLPVLLNDGSGLDMREKGLPDISYNPKKKKNAKPGLVRKPSYASGQAAINLPGVLMFDRATGCSVIDCVIRECGWYGIRVQTSCRDLLFEGNFIHELGGGGIQVCGMPYYRLRQKPHMENSRIVFLKNHICDCGKFFYSSVGILLRHASGCLIQQNHIHDLYYTGISAGWSWGYSNSVTHDIRIRGNHVHDIGKGILSDMGGIYLLGRQPGTRVYENVIRNVHSRLYNGVGIYPDEGTSHIVVEKNIVTGCSSEGFYQHYGNENIVRHNVFAFNAGGASIGRDNGKAPAYPGEFHGYAMSLVNNVFYMNKGGAVSIRTPIVYQQHKIYSDSNVFYYPEGKKEFAAAKISRLHSFAEWQAAGYDRLSVFTDPGFQDPEKGNFRLKKDSILWKYGFDFLNKMQK